jgi:hypothetical protein
MPATTPEQIDTFIRRWENSGAAERANYALFLSELCILLDLPRPDPPRLTIRKTPMSSSGPSPARIPTPPPPPASSTSTAAAPSCWKASRASRTVVAVCDRRECNFTTFPVDGRMNGNGRPIETGNRLYCKLVQKVASEGGDSSPDLRAPAETGKKNGGRISFPHHSKNL